MLLNVILLIAIATLVVVLILELASYRKFIQERDAIIDTILKTQAALNANADVQEKMRLALIEHAQELDMIEKMLGTHAYALKIIGPLLPYSDLDREKISKT